MKLDECCSYTSHLGTLSAPIITPVQCKPWTNPTMFSSLGIATTWGRIKPAHARIPGPWQHTVIRWSYKKEHDNLPLLSATHLKDSGLSRHQTPGALSLQLSNCSGDHLRLHSWDPALASSAGELAPIFQTKWLLPCFFTGKQCQQVLSIPAGKAAQKLSLNVSY